MLLYTVEPDLRLPLTFTNLLLSLFFQLSNSTALHVAVEQEDLTSLHIVDFLAQNW